MPRKTTPQKPRDAPLDHTDARMQAQLKKLQAAFADQLVDAFSTVVIRTAMEPASTLAALTLAQHEELLACLQETVTRPPPEFEAALAGALDDDDEPPKKGA